MRTVAGELWPMHGPLSCSILISLPSRTEAQLPPPAQGPLLSFAPGRGLSEGAVTHSLGALVFIQ